MTDTSYPAPVRLRRAPSHPGAVFADILDDAKMSVSVVAKNLGISRQLLHRILNGQSPVTTDTALRFSKFCGNSARLWLNLQQAYDLWHTEKRLAPELKRIKPPSAYYLEHISEHV